MKEITDKDLAAIRSNLSACNPLVQSLVARLDRVEGELETCREEITCMCGSPIWSHTSGDGHTPISQRSYRVDAERASVCEWEECLAGEIYQTACAPALREYAPEIPYGCPKCGRTVEVAENTALRKRVKRMEAALQEITKYTEVASYFQVEVPSHASQIAKAALKEGE